MQQERHARRKPFAKLLPFLAGAVTVAAVLVACDRPSTHADMGAPEDVVRHAQAPMNIQVPAAEAAAAKPAAVPASTLPPAEALADTAITSRIKSEILQDPAMGGADVSVNTDRGVVVLAGLVKTPEQTAVASAHAQKQDGVLRVDNHLAIAQQ